MCRWSNHHCFRYWLVAWSATSHYLNQCWDIVNWTLMNKLQWNFNRYSSIFIQENGFENVVCEMASILSRPQCVNAHCFMVIWGTGSCQSDRLQCLQWQQTKLCLPLLQSIAFHTNLNAENWVVIKLDGTAGGHHDNLWCHKWWQSWHFDNSCQILITLLAMLL